MGRRALPKIDPAIDLAGYLWQPQDLPQPWDPMQVFALRQPLEIEVGSGKGLFMETAAAACPQHNFLGVEIAFKYARHSAARLARRRAPNAVMVHGDAVALLRDLMPDASVAAIHVYFPDPWWKKRHRKRRLVHPGFLHQVQRVLRDNGQLHLWTDVAEYFEQALKLIADHTTLKAAGRIEERPPEHELDYRTHFERRMRQHQIPVQRALYRKAPPSEGRDK